jgi:hypothetical protein
MSTEFDEISLSMYSNLDLEHSNRKEFKRINCKEIQSLINVLTNI